MAWTPKNEIPILNGFYCKATSKETPRFQSRKKKTYMSLLLLLLVFNAHWSKKCQINFTAQLSKRDQYFHTPLFFGNVLFCFLQDFTAHLLKRFTAIAVNIFSSFDIFSPFYKKYRTLFYEKWHQTTSSTKVRLLLRVLAMYVTQYVFGTLRLLQSLSSFNWWWEYTSSSKPSKALPACVKVIY